MNKRIKWGGLGILLLLIIVTIGFIINTLFYTPFTANNFHIYIDSDDNIDSVKSKIGSNITDDKVFIFEMLSKSMKYRNNIRTGKYLINKDQNAIEVLRTLRGGMQVPVKVRIPQARNIFIIAGKVSKELMLDSCELAAFFNKQNWCTELNKDSILLSCMFIPNTYEMYWDVSVDQFMKRIFREHHTFWNKDRLLKAEKIGLSTNEVSILASIVECETNNNDEKPIIAGMYLNRLKLGMKLQADPTVKFALQDFSLKRILHKHLEIDSPYNTYIYKGLPPGPITIPSIKSVDAVLNAQSHNYLYMCAKEDFSGKHNFAATYTEHLRNAKRYTSALNKKKIK